MRKILRFLMKRSVVTTLLALLQLAFSGVLLYSLRLIPAAYYIFVALSVAATMFVMRRDNIDPNYKLGWILLILVLPGMGAVYYLAYGASKIIPAKYAHINDIEQKTNAELAAHEQGIVDIYSLPDSLYPHVRYISHVSEFPVYKNTYCDYFAVGEDFYGVFLDELRKAKRCIFMEYFIIDSGEVWDEVFGILREKAAQGVDVRLVYDWFGCAFKIPEDFAEQLKAAGIKGVVFNPLELTWRISHILFANHRDHRKVCVIDGEVGFTGGLNLADEYINKIERFGYWKDAAVIIKGPAVFSLTVTFAKLWQLVVNEDFDPSLYIPQTAYKQAGYVQPYADSPLDEFRVCKLSYFNLISRAKRYVYITTPYLVLDNDMITALSLSAQSGVDVRIILPSVPDKDYVFRLTQSYYRTLIAAGVKIYQYTPGFLHSKMFVSDDEIAIIGSANMDYRSLYLHFENNCSFYNTDISAKVKQDIYNTIELSQRITMEDIEQTPLYMRMYQLLLRLLAPLL